MSFKQIMAASLLGTCLLGTIPAHAADYLFTCKNYWTQDVLVTVTADSVDAARKQLKTDKAMADKYSIDASAICAFRSELKPDPKRHKKKSPYIDYLDPMSRDAGKPKDDE